MNQYHDFSDINVLANNMLIANESKRYHELNTKFLQNKKRKEKSLVYSLSTFIRLMLSDPL